ncbi:MAG TPA: RNA 2'-phosphotransferase [Candidatus Limosilactobacillus merdipullorum]|uniref:Probable RNA 2'-phosphotransferase n=1 Tax=Candidatus Limosilactobacillus merdipullorum TaxID=2838653 RepID=A0A9D1U448_9LACO|nr:RNA 2'-phosphotransferase [Candidatus Limosilactobacillus merdipullorum]
MTNNKDDQQRLDGRTKMFINKKMSYALRHNPQKYGLKLDKYGYVDLHQFLDAMNRVHHFRPRLTEMTIREIMHGAKKQRFKIKNGQICALYGHSIPGIIKHPEKVPPKVLSHGTARRFLPSIEKRGLLPMGRQYVHLSADVDTAEAVGKRRDQHPAILKFNAAAAHKDGVKFYYANDQVWLVDQVAPKYLSR